MTASTIATMPALQQGNHFTYLLGGIHLSMLNAYKGIFMSSDFILTLVDKKLEEGKSIRDGFDCEDMYETVGRIIKKWYPESEGRNTNPITGAPYPRKKFEAMCRQTRSILSTSSTQGIFASGSLRPEYKDMCKGVLRPLFYNKELYEWNVNNGFKGQNQIHSNWHLVTQDTPVEYITPYPMDLAQQQLDSGERKTGRRGKCYPLFVPNIA